MWMSEMTCDKHRQMLVSLQVFIGDIQSDIQSIEDSVMDLAANEILWHKHDGRKANGYFVGTRKEITGQVDHEDLGYVMEPVRSYLFYSSLSNMCVCVPDLPRLLSQTEKQLNLNLQKLKFINLQLMKMGKEYYQGYIPAGFVTDHQRHSENFSRITHGSINKSTDTHDLLGLRDVEKALLDGHRHLACRCCPICRSTVKMYCVTILNKLEILQYARQHIVYFNMHKNEENHSFASKLNDSFVGDGLSGFSTDYKNQETDIPSNQSCSGHISELCAMDVRNRDYLSDITSDSNWDDDESKVPCKETGSSEWQQAPDTSLMSSERALSVPKNESPSWKGRCSSIEARELQPQLCQSSSPVALHSVDDDAQKTRAELPHKKFRNKDRRKWKKLKVTRFSESTIATEGAIDSDTSPVHHKARKFLTKWINGNDIHTNAINVVANTGGGCKQQSVSSSPSTKQICRLQGTRQSIAGTKETNEFQEAMQSINVTKETSEFQETRQSSAGNKETSEFQGRRHSIAGAKETREFLETKPSIAGTKDICEFKRTRQNSAGTKDICEFRGTRQSSTGTKDICEYQEVGQSSAGTKDICEFQEVGKSSAGKKAGGCEKAEQPVPINIVVRNTSQTSNGNKICRLDLNSFTSNKAVPYKTGRKRKTARQQSSEVQSTVTLRNTLLQDTKQSSNLHDLNTLIQKSPDQRKVLVVPHDSNLHVINEDITDKRKVTVSETYQQVNDAHRQNPPDKQTVTQYGVYSKDTKRRSRRKRRARRNIVARSAPDLRKVVCHTAEEQTKMNDLLVSRTVPTVDGQNTKESNQGSPAIRKVLNKTSNTDSSRKQDEYYPTKWNSCQRLQHENASGRASMNTYRIPLKGKGKNRGQETGIQLRDLLLGKKLHRKETLGPETKHQDEDSITNQIIQRVQAPSTKENTKAVKKNRRNSTRDMKVSLGCTVKEELAKKNVPSAGDIQRKIQDVKDQFDLYSISETHKTPSVLKLPFNFDASSCRTGD